MFVQTMVSNKFIGHGIVIGVFVLATDPLQFRLGKHALSPRHYAPVHLLGHERLRAFRARALLVHHLLVRHLRRTRRHLHRLLPPRRGRLPRLTHTPRPPARAPPDPRRSLLPPSRHRVPAPGTSTTRTSSTSTSPPKTVATSRHATSAITKNTRPSTSPRSPRVDTDINIYPERRSFDGTARMTLQNKTAAPLAQLHITDTNAVRLQHPVRPSRSPRQQWSPRHLPHLRL